MARRRVYTANREIKRGGVIIPPGAHFRAQYDFTQGTNAEGGRKRRVARIETGGEETVLTNTNRHKGINLVRDMLRNNPQMRGLQKTLKTSVIGEYGKLRFNATGDWFTAAQNYFNKVWGSHADFVDGSTFREILQLVVSCIAFEGDCVIVFDNGILTGDNGTGKLLAFEADQITNLTEEDWKAFVAESKEREAWTQESGIIRDEYGRKCGVICAKSRGVAAVSRKDALILTCDPNNPDASPWRHIVRKFRLRQLRGVPDAFAAIQSACDTYEILGYELQSAKAQAAHYAAIIEGEDTAEATATGFDDSEPTEAEEIEEAEKEEETIEAEGLERYCAGGLVDVFPHGTTVQVDNPTRPNKDLPAFLDYTGDLAGLAFGLWHSIARGRSDSSYTSFRGDIVQTALTFRDFQKFLENAFADWVAVSVLSRAVALGELDTPPEGWEGVIAWQYPTAPEVDAQKEAAARAQKYRNGELTLRETLGPAWREQLKQLADERDYMRALGLRHPCEETVSGQIIDNQKQEKNDGEDNKD